VDPPLELPTLDNSETYREQRISFYAQLLRQTAIPAEMLSAVGQATRGVNRFARPLAVDATLDEGDSISLAGHAWQVLHMPGHAAGLICLYEPGSGTLLSSDHLLATFRPTRWSSHHRPATTSGSGAWHCTGRLCSEQQPWG